VAFTTEVVMSWVLVPRRVMTPMRRSYCCRTVEVVRRRWSSRDRHEVLRKAAAMRASSSLWTLLSWPGHAHGLDEE
jgi:hypothetical protein